MASNAEAADCFSPILFANIVITGFNTDIEYQGTTYHVQTEDKGVKTPLILSLVYDRGTILASKRSHYDDLLIGSFDETKLTERLQKQHKLICAAVRTGRIEDLKRMTVKESASKQPPALVESDLKSVAGVRTFLEEKLSGSNLEINLGKIPATAASPGKIDFFDQPKGEKSIADAVENLSVVKSDLFSKPKDELIWDVPLSIVEEPISEIVQFVEEFILPAEAVEIVGEFDGANLGIDNKLRTRLLTDEKFRSGDRKTLCIAVNRGNAAKGLSGAQVMVKVLGSSFRPLIFHAKTDENGVATVHLQLPQFKSGRAALLIKAISDGEEADLRRVITHD